MTTNIQRVIESIEKLHGGDRAQKSKHESYCTWLLRRRQSQLGGQNVIKVQADEEKR